MRELDYDVVVIGGGFFGLYIAEFMAKSGKRTLVIEREAVLMSRASHVNQARVHNGYHYPRSVLTALRSRISFPVFVDEFKDCIVSDFDKYYLIANLLSKVTGNQFKTFCERIGAPYTKAPKEITSLINPNLIDQVLKVKEFAFDSFRLRDAMKERTNSVGVTVIYEHEVESVHPDENDNLLLNVTANIGKYSLRSKQVFNCTYSKINRVLHNSGLEIIPLKHELTEICLVDTPIELNNIGITVMCGPFFSMMPFPTHNAHSFTHVRYTPHFEWYEKKNNDCENGLDYKNGFIKNTAWLKMIKDAQRYIPLLSECNYRESLWETKTVLPLSESDDSRPILFKANYGMKGFHCVMGGKIDNVYDVINVIKRLELHK
ncbi:FAD-dependent oxidoreductase [Vibrio cholerae]